MDNLVESFERLAATYGPAVADAALGAARTEGISYLFSSVIWFGLAYASYRTGQYLRTADHPNDVADFAIPIGWFFLIIGVFLAAGGAWAVLNPWVWAAIFQPDLYLAKRAFNL